MYKIHDLKPPAGSNRARKRVGRGIGGKGGKTAGRGTKGQKARNTVHPGFEGGQLPLAQRLPKLKGFNNPFRVEYNVINLDTLAQMDTVIVTPETLRERGLVHKHGLVKVNPIAAWNDFQVEIYQTANGLPRNPLVAQGYPSIGCEPCTRKVAPGEDPRSGRWAGTDKIECGLHLPGS